MKILETNLFLKKIKKKYGLSNNGKNLKFKGKIESKKFEIVLESIMNIFQVLINKLF